MEDTNLIKFNQALSEYYKLKKQYDEQTEKIVSKLRTNTNLNKKEKRDKFKQLNSAKKCINCGKVGGSIFKQENNLLSVSCGNKEKSCKLDIQLQKAKYANINEQIQNLNKKIYANKTNTIYSKLNFLFGYKSESTTIDSYNKFKIDLVEQVNKYQILNEQYLNIVSNVLTGKDLTENNNILISSIQKLKSLIKNFEESSDIGFLKEATDLYINVIDETVKNIQSLKYSNNSLIFDDKSKTYHLLQYQYTLAQLQVPIDKTVNKILSFKK